MKSYSDSAVDTSHIEATELKLLEAIREKELQLAVTISNGLHHASVENTRTAIVLIATIVVQGVINIGLWLK
jgi:hypothetical protein